jgi:hypothetical protein
MLTTEKKEIITSIRICITNTKKAKLIPRRQRTKVRLRKAEKPADITD